MLALGMGADVKGRPSCSQCANSQPNLKCKYAEGNKRYIKEERDSLSHLLMSE